jgi:ATP-dependent DNA helicase RecQ
MSERASISEIKNSGMITADALAILKNTFGYDQFRGQQQAIIESVIAGADALVLMPTGGGKSLCYQIPAMARSGVGIVISPLIALMQDQVSALHQLGVQAAFLNSSLGSQQQLAVENAARSGELDLLYIAPERLLQPRTMALLQAVEISLFAIDEAHCVSQWGHDFRQDYLQLSVLHEQFPGVPRIALTATADERTRQEIIQRLQLSRAGLFVDGFDRPNIRYTIRPKNNPKKQLLDFLATHPADAGIIYCLSRRKVEETAEWLSNEGWNALPYHAGLSVQVRERNQTRFLREEGIIIVATIAFGMGIDKPDVRFVAHLDLPKSIEAYYQETGRAGRDGLPADAWMVFGLQDVTRLQQMLASSEAEEKYKRIENHKLNALLGLCEITTCRRQALLSYFGDELQASCGNCDVCLEPPQTWDATLSVQKVLSCVYRTGQRFGVNHVIDVLLGSDNEKIRRFAHDRLSTYGIGGELTLAQWRTVIRQLVVRGFLKVDMDAFGALQLTDACRPVLRGEQALFLRQYEKQKKAGRGGSGKALIDPDDQAMWSALRACRKRLADEQGVPPYVIFHDATLLEMLKTRPRRHQEFARLNGVGETKLNKYADAFIEAIAASELAQADKLLDL